MWLFVSLRLYRRQEGHVMGDRVYRRMLGTALVLTLSAIPATARGPEGRGRRLGHVLRAVSVWGHPIPTTPGRRCRRHRGSRTRAGHGHVQSWNAPGSGCAASRGARHRFHTDRHPILGSGRAGTATGFGCGSGSVPPRERRDRTAVRVGSRRRRARRPRRAVERAGDHRDRVGYRDEARGQG